MFAYISGGVMLLVVLALVFQNGRAWGILPEVMKDMWNFSRRIGMLSFSFQTSAAAWYLWNGEEQFPKTAGVWLVFMIAAVISWLYFIYLEMQSVKWETLLRQSLCVMSWDSRMANLTPERVDDVLSFLMANDDFLRVLMQAPSDERKKMFKTASIDFHRSGRLNRNPSSGAGRKGKEGRA